MIFAGPDFVTWRELVIAPASGWLERNWLGRDVCRISMTRSCVLQKQTDREDQKYRRGNHARSIAALSQRPQRVSDAIDDLNNGPEDDEPSHARPTAPYRPKETANTEREQSNVENDEAQTAIFANKTGNECRWREHYLKASHVLFNRVKCLHSYKRCKGCIETSHRWRGLTKRR